MFTLARGGCDSRRSLNKNPRWEIGLGCDDVMPGSDELGFLVILEKKQLVEIWRWTKRVENRTWARLVELWSTGCAAHCWFRWISQHSKNCVSLSSCRKTKLKKSINVSYLNHQSRQWFGIPMHVNIFRIRIIIRILDAFVLRLYLHIYHKHVNKMDHLVDYGRAVQ